ncbi:uncharacterized protein [Henckelia pumila]|uniref:uncharacterized protein n=1 Tax=Henckelia pumila TaxID=405737 RepID=UPI003C6E4B55
MFQRNFDEYRKSEKRLYGYDSSRRERRDDDDSESYLKWEKRVEFLFEGRDFSEARKFKLVLQEFTDYACTWWDKVVVNRKRHGVNPISTWDEMKRAMRKLFAPNHCESPKREHQEIESNVVVEVESKVEVKSRIKDETSLIIDKSIEICAVEGEWLVENSSIVHGVVDSGISVESKCEVVGEFVCVEESSNVLVIDESSIDVQSENSTLLDESCNFAIQLSPKEFFEDQLEVENLCDMIEKKSDKKVIGDVLMSKQRRYNIKSLNMLDPCEGEVECLKVFLFERYDVDANRRYNFNTKFQRYEFNSMLHGFNYFVEGFEKVLAMNYALSSNLDVKSFEFVHTTRVGYLVYVDICECCKNSIGGKSYLPDWLLLTFGLTNVRNTFMGLMGCVFHASMGNFVVIYFDFILVYSKIFKVHVEHYGIVLIMLDMKFLGHEHVRKLNVFRAKELIDFGVSSQGLRVVGEELIKYQRGKENVLVTTLSQRSKKGRNLIFVLLNGILIMFKHVKGKI